MLKSSTLLPVSCSEFCLFVTSGRSFFLIFLVLFIIDVLSLYTAHQESLRLLQIPLPRNWPYWVCSSHVVIPPSFPRSRAFIIFVQLFDFFFFLSNLRSTARPCFVSQRYLNRSTRFPRALGFRQCTFVLYELFLITVVI